MDGAPDTFPRPAAHARASCGPTHPATREKDLGIWQTWTWREVAAEVRALACGLAAQGFARGMHLAIIGDNRPRLYWAMIAAQALGGVPVPMYQDAPAAEFVVRARTTPRSPSRSSRTRSRSTSCSRSRPHVPTLAHIYLRRSARPAQLRRRDELRRAARRSAASSTARIRASSTREVAQGRPDDVVDHALHLGHHRQAQGRAPDARARSSPRRAAAASSTSSTPDDSVLSYLPMAWVGDHLFSYAQWLVAGFTHQLPRVGRHGDDRPARDRPDLLLRAAARVREPADAGDDPHGGRERASSAGCSATSSAVARRCGAEHPRRQAGVGSATACSTRSATSLVYAPLRNVLGMSRIRVAYTAGAAIGPDLFRFYRSIGINLKQLYGSTETCAYVCLQPDGGGASSTPSAQPAPGVEMRDRRQRRGAGARADAAQGVLQAARRDRRVDRRRRLLPHRRRRLLRRRRPAARSSTARRTSASSRPARCSRRTTSRTSSSSSRTSRRRWRSATAATRVCAFINIDMGSVGNWAERRGLAYSGYTDLAAKPEVLRADPRVRRAGQRRARARRPTLADSQVHRFLILHKELDPDDDELTRTRKVRRGFVAEKYAVLIDALYGGRDVAAHRDAGQVRGRPHAAWSRADLRDRRRAARSRRARARPHDARAEPAPSSAPMTPRAARDRRGRCSPSTTSRCRSAA